MRITFKCQKISKPIVKNKGKWSIILIGINRPIYNNKFFNGYRYKNP